MGFGNRGATPVAYADRIHATISGIVCSRYVTSNDHSTAKQEASPAGPNRWPIHICCIESNTKARKYGGSRCSKKYKR